MKFRVTVLLVGGQNKIGGCFVLRSWKRGLVRTKKGVFCAEESRGGAMTIDFCKKFGKDL